MAEQNENMNMLLEMGFSENKAKRALAATSNLQDAMEWLIAHADELTDEAPVAAAAATPTLSLKTPVVADSNENKPMEQEGNVEKKEGEDAAATAEAATAAELQANSLKCDECGKLLRDSDAATAHAYKTGHSSFSESAESIKPKTKEEIEEQKKVLAEKLIKMRAEKAEKERQDEIEREIKRRQSGRQIHEIRQKHAEEEMKRLAEERRREKREAEANRQRVKEQIASDRERLKLQQQAEKGGQVQLAAAPVVAQQPAVVAEKRSYDECKIQVRLTDGKTMQHTFRSKEQLAAVRLWIEMNRTDEKTPFQLLQPFPRKQYTDDDMERTLEDLGLVPASSLVVTKRV